MTTQGVELTLDSLSGRLVVLYFFRRAFTRNCTVETKGFRDNYPDLSRLGCEVVGVSCDAHATQCRFAAEHAVTFPMIADSDRRISSAYQVFFWLLPSISHRVTYVIEDQTILGVFNHEFQVMKHLDEVTRFVRAQRPTVPPPSPNAAP